VVQAAREQAGAVEKFRVRRPNNGWLRLELTMREVRGLLLESRQHNLLLVTVLARVLLHSTWAAQQRLAAA
jgi:hypothetical protein